MKNPQDTSTSTAIDSLVKEVGSSNNYVKNNKETADKIIQEVQISNDEKDKDAEDRCKEFEFKVSGVRRSKMKQKLKAHMNKHHPVGLSISKVSTSDDKQIPMSKYKKMHIAADTKVQEFNVRNLNNAKIASGVT